MSENFYKLTLINTAGATTIESAGKNITVHTVVIPRTMVGSAIIEGISGTDYLALPTATQNGTYILDSVFADGLKVVTSGTDVIAISWKD